MGIHEIKYIVPSKHNLYTVQYYKSTLQWMYPINTTNHAVNVLQVWYYQSIETCQLLQYEKFCCVKSYFIAYLSFF